MSKKTFKNWQNMARGPGWCQEPVVMCGNWNDRQAMSQKVFTVTTFSINACFQSFSTLVSRIVQHAVLKFSPYVSQ